MFAAGGSVSEKGGSMEKEKTECVMSSVIRIETWHEHKAGVPEVVRNKPERPATAEVQDTDTISQERRMRVLQ